MTTSISIFEAAANFHRPDPASEFLSSLLRGLGHDINTNPASISSSLEQAGVGWCDEYLHISFPLALRNIIPASLSAVSVSRALTEHGWIKCDKDGKRTISTRWEGRVRRMMTIPFFVEESAIQWRHEGPTLESMTRSLIRRFGIQFVATAMSTTNASVMTWLDLDTTPKQLNTERLLALYAASMQLPTIRPLRFEAIGW